MSQQMFHGRRQTARTGILRQLTVDKPPNDGYGSSPFPKEVLVAQEIQNGILNAQLDLIRTGMELDYQEWLERTGGEIPVEGTVS
jgi:hypothetical protein